MIHNQVIFWLPPLLSLFVLRKCKQSGWLISISICSLLSIVIHSLFELLDVPVFLSDNTLQRLGQLPSLGSATNWVMSRCLAISASFLMTRNHYLSDCFEDITPIDVTFDHLKQFYYSGLYFLFQVWSFKTILVQWALLTLLFLNILTYKYKHFLILPSCLARYS